MDIRVRKISVIVIFVLISLFTVSSVLAYMIVSDQGVNHFTVGNNESHIEEKFDSYEMFEKGQEYEKEVSVTNDGTVDCYVRVFAEVENPETAEKIEINFNDTEWTEKQEDGYYYYKKPLKTGESTTPLFTHIKATEDIDDFKMIVYEETVQAHGFDDAIKAFSSVN